MKVLLIGEKPETVDFSDPALPPGLTAERIRLGIEQAMKLMSDRGWQADLCLIRADDSGIGELQRALSLTTYDCVVIGGGIRIPPKRLLFFERVLNAVHSQAPTAAIAFNTSPDNTPDAAARWMRKDSPTH